MKLRLLAMSGVRAHNPELTALGLTLPGFVERNRVIASLPSLGLLTLAGATPEDVPVEYIDVPEVLPSPWLPSGFDAVAISSFSAQIKEAYEDIWQFVRDSGLYEVQITVQTAFPGTPLYDRPASA